MRRAARVDANHTEIVAHLRGLGWYVHDTSRLGGGFPDLVCAKGGKLRMVEVKDGSKPKSAQKLTADEWLEHLRFAAAGVTVHILTSVEDAEALR